MSGACTCPAVQLDKSGCRCGWYDLQCMVEFLATEATPDQIATLAPALIAKTQSIALAARVAALQECKSGWTGTRAAFAQRFGITASRLSALGIMFRK